MATEIPHELMNVKQRQIAARATYLNITQAELREREPGWFEDEKPDTERGLYAKYQVRKINGKPIGKCFVLEEHDPFAIAAIRAYADACEATHPLLAGDLRGWSHEWTLGHMDGGDDG